ncbi:MAG: hypothetical protein ACO1QR_12875 [Chthoniobacteraceae bacterium]
MSEDPTASRLPVEETVPSYPGAEGSDGGQISIEEFHRKMAVELFNAVWALLEKENRNCAENDRMIHAAHASRFHWEIAGQPINWGIGEWQVSRVHAVMKQQDTALYHAFRYLEIAEDYALGPFHVAYAHEALARAYAIDDSAKAAEHLAKARTHGEKIEDPEERALLEADLGTIAAAK